MKLYQQERNSLFSTCAVVNDKIYAFTSFQRLPIMVDVHSGNFVLLENLSNYDPLFFADNMLSVGDDIFVLESNGNRLLKYNVNEKICQYYNIACHVKDWDNYVAFTHYGECLYVIPRYIDELLKIDIKSGKVQKDKDLYLRTNDHKTSTMREDNMCFCYGFQQENIMWLFQRKSNMLIAYDVEKTKWEKYELSVEINNCVHAVCFNKKIYILSREGKIYCWNIVNKSVEFIVDCSEETLKDKTFSRIIVTEKRLFLFPALGENIFQIDMDTKQVQKNRVYPNDFHYCGREDWSKFYGYCEDERYYYFPMRSMNFILLINKQNGKEQWIKPKLPSCEMYEKTYLTYSKRLLNEKECILWSFLKYLNGENMKENNNHFRLIGGQIWNQMKNV